MPCRPPGGRRRGEWTGSSSAAKAAGPAPCTPQWARDVVGQCAEHSTAAWFKQWGSWGPADWKPEHRAGEDQAAYVRRAAATGATHAYAPDAHLRGHQRRSSPTSSRGRGERDQRPHAAAWSEDPPVGQGQGRAPARRPARSRRCPPPRTGPRKGPRHDRRAQPNCPVPPGRASRRDQARRRSWSRCSATTAGQAPSATVRSSSPRPRLPAPPAAQTWSASACGRRAGWALTSTRSRPPGRTGGASSTTRPRPRPGGPTATGSGSSPCPGPSPPPSLPEGWGLMELPASGRRFKIRVPAETRKDITLTVPLLVELLRRAPNYKRLAGDRRTFAASTATASPSSTGPGARRPTTAAACPGRTGSASTCCSRSKTRSASPWTPTPAGREPRSKRSPPPSWPRSWPTPGTHVTIQRRKEDLDHQRRRLREAAMPASSTPRPVRPQGRQAPPTTPGPPWPRPGTSRQGNRKCPKTPNLTARTST